MIVIDTHVLLWWVNGDIALSKAAAKAIKSTFLWCIIICQIKNAMRIKLLL